MNEHLSNAEILANEATRYAIWSKRFAILSIICGGVAVLAQLVGLFL